MSDLSEAYAFDHPPPTATVIDDDVHGGESATIAAKPAPLPGRLRKLSCCECRRRKVKCNTIFLIFITASQFVRHTRFCWKECGRLFARGVGDSWRRNSKVEYAQYQLRFHKQSSGLRWTGDVA